MTTKCLLQVIIIFKNVYLPHPNSRQCAELRLKFLHLLSTHPYRLRCSSVTQMQRLYWWKYLSFGEICWGGTQARTVRFCITTDITQLAIILREIYFHNGNQQFILISRCYSDELDSANKKNIQYIIRVSESCSLPQIKIKSNLWLTAPKGATPVN